MKIYKNADDFVWSLFWCLILIQGDSSKTMRNVEPCPAAATVTTGSNRESRDSLHYSGDIQGQTDENPML